MAVSHFRGEEARVSFGELFYDLVFVFAITQISHHLLHHFTVAGAFQTGLLFMAVWWVWIYSTWAFNRIDPDQVAGRFLLFLLMAAGLFLSMAIPDAFGDRGAVFGVAFAAMQVGRSVFVLAVTRDMPVVHRTYRRILSWVSLAAVFWVWGGFAAPEMRAWLWACALGVELLAPAMGMPFRGWAARKPPTGRSMAATWPSVAACSSSSALGKPC